MANQPHPIGIEVFRCRTSCLRKNIFQIRSRYSLDPSLVRSNRTPFSLYMLHDNIPCWCHCAGGKWNVQVVWFLSPPLFPARTPRSQGRTKVFETLKRIEVGSQRGDYVVCGNQGRAVDRPKIWSYVNQNNIRTNLLGSRINNSIKRSGSTVRGRIIIQAAGPTVRELILKLGQPKITRNQVQAVLNALRMCRRNVASSF